MASTSLARILTALLLLLPGCAHGGPSDFEQAWTLAERDGTSDAGRPYLDTLKGAGVALELMGRFHACSREGPVSARVEMAAVLALSSAGEVRSVHTSRGGRLPRCFDRSARNVHFPPPPHDGFHYRVAFDAFRIQ